MLKNLGSFLGQMTIARNKPLLQRQLDLNELLYHGYDNPRVGVTGLWGEGWDIRGPRV